MGSPKKQSFPDKVLQLAMRAPCVQPLLIRTAGTDVESDIDAVDFRPGQEFVENESQNVTLVLVNLNLGAHLVGGILYLGGQPLLVDLVSFASIDLVERFSVVAYPFGPAVLAAAEHEHRRGAGRWELDVLGELCGAARIAEYLPARDCDAHVLQHGPREPASTVKCPVALS